MSLVLYIKAYDWLVYEPYRLMDMRIMGNAAIVSSSISHLQELMAMGPSSWRPVANIANVQTTDIWVWSIVYATPW
jgi:hypothetical protein